MVAWNSLYFHQQELPHKESRMSSLKEKVCEIEREEILHALEDNEWVMARAARKLGITERMIGYKIRKYGIRKEGELLGDTGHSGILMQSSH
jgi:Nif-specific regulatory protein